MASERRVGFTLLELMVALGLAVIVVGMLYEILGGGARAYVRGTEILDLRRAGEVALEKLAAEIEQAKKVDKAPGSYDGTSSLRGERIGVLRFSDSSDRRLYRTDALLEFYSQESTAVTSRYDLIRKLTPLDSDGKKTGTVQESTVLEGMLLEPASFETDSSRNDYVMIHLKMKAQPGPMAEQPTVNLTRTAYVMSHG